MRELLAVLLSVLALAGCNAAPRVGDTLTLHGTLVLKGNAPRTTPVLVRSDTEQWELQQVQDATATALQNRKVRASGIVGRTPQQGLLPVLRVTALAPQP
ncbi:MAG TPA: hypothetical protein VHL79_18640 [Ramlibacter sp.]|jgi:uncharacterized protein YcfL|nr:hypothetical protein [Ramlibacter sp.]